MGPSGARRDEPFRRLPQIRIRAQGRVDPAAHRSRPTPVRVLRDHRLAGISDRERHPSRFAVGRGLASAWAITRHLGTAGFRRLVRDIASAKSALIDTIRGIDGLRVVGDPQGPVFAVAADHDSPDPVDPHRWADEVASRGFTLQAQPGFTQGDGTALAPSTHLTITPITARIVGELSEALVLGATAARGVSPAQAPTSLAELGAAFASGTVSVEDALGLDSATTEAILVGAGIDPHTDPAAASDALDLSAVIAAIDLLPRPVTAKMLTEFLAAFTNP